MLRNKQKGQTCKIRDAYRKEKDREGEERRESETEIQMSREGRKASRS